jgi:hypothetical protein
MEVYYFKYEQACLRRDHAMQATEATGKEGANAGWEGSTGHF